MFIEWHDQYSIGVERIDAQHRGLVERLNLLFEKLGPEMDAGQLRSLVEDFQRYAETHFVTEERIARAGGYPVGPMRAHCAEHQAYRDRMIRFVQAFENGERHTGVQLMSFLHGWWIAHICGSDQDLGRHLTQRREQ